VRQLLEPLRDEAGDSGAPAPPATPSVPESYRKWLLSQCSSVELLGLRLRHGQTVRLNNVYVPLTTVSGREPTGDERERASRRSLGDERDRLTLLLHRLGESSLYVSGDAGSGKSRSAAG